MLSLPSFYLDISHHCFPSVDLIFVSCYLLEQYQYLLCSSIPLKKFSFSFHHSLFCLGKKATTPSLSLATLAKKQSCDGLDTSITPRSARTASAARKDSLLEAYIHQRHSLHDFNQNLIPNFAMLFSTRFLALVALLSTFSLITATPVPCTDRTRDLVLQGLLDPSACCSYGVCKGDVNVESG